MRLNLGCGDRYVDGWVNVDWQSPHRVDERVDLTGPLPTNWRGEVTNIYVGHLLEHVSKDDCLKLAQRLLECAHPNGCLLVAVGPDVPVAEEMVRNGTFDWNWGTLDEIKFGAGRWAGDVHLWETSGEDVAQLLRDAGWPLVWNLGLDVLEGGWPIADPGPRWQYAVRAYVSEGDE